MLHRATIGVLLWSIDGSDTRQYDQEHDPVLVDEEIPPLEMKCSQLSLSDQEQNEIHRQRDRKDIVLHPDR